jgi:hypothetical protein
VINKPTFGENLRFFFSYQLGHMYLRYLMWNFSGRQNDIQGHGSPIEGNWISGIKPIDRVFLGPQDNLPSSITSNPGHSKYYLLPFILGIIGLVFQAQRKPDDALVVGLLFFMTGIAIIIYLNQTPYQPRERDYSYIASFWAFSVWVGLGVLALYDAMQRKLKGKLPAILALFFVFYWCPLSWQRKTGTIMIVQEDTQPEMLPSTTWNHVPQMPSFLPWATMIHSRYGMPRK